ncbi:MAG: hypothetical protein KGO01_17240, partial [Burkholderiales bacterium]|nr:hypothetical protein [Burkholderiales bacterium]
PQRRSGLPRHNHAPVVAAAPANEVRVRSGDSLSRIANRTQQPGISLDQMLVSLFRGNPQAFSGDNMNRLKAGVLLTVPSAEQASKVSTPQAHSIIVAQAADFAAYRQRLAAGAPLAADNAPARQGRGQVQAQVADRKAEAAPTPDRLTLTQGGVKASSPEARVSKETQKQDEKARLAELNRNVEELKRLQGATAPAVVAASTTPAAPALAPAPLAAASATPSTLVAVPGPAPKPSAPLAASAPAKPKFAPPPPAAEEPGFLDSLMENSLLLPGLGVLAVLLGAFGIYKLRGRARKPVGETSFLESRLQPDSFFGASGGQRIDTREAGSSSNSSSMSYSLSQLDAIGDVDPVAEADVYLAYGRDLQAEEILKEAMRATPERLAIRSKLLEVYAKRRDAKAYELLATQLHNLTHGEGEEWSKAQALGLTIDPENPLYRPGGQPSAVHGAGGQVVPDALGAPTQPYTAPPPKPMFEPAADATLDHGLDLELDLPAAAAVPTTAKLAAGEVTQPFTTDALPPPESNLDLPLEPVDFDKTLPPPPFAAAPAADPGLDFDLESLNMPVDAPTVAMKRPEPEQDKVDFGDFSIGGEPLTSEPEPADHAPLARKIDLAEEFRQIGDLEGARDLLEEVIAKADGALKSKAQGMLDKLA